MIVQMASARMNAMTESKVDLNLRVAHRLILGTDSRLMTECDGSLQLLVIAV